MAALSSSLITVPSESGGLLQTLAEFVEAQPLAAAIVAAVLAVLVLLLLRKAFSVALNVIAIGAVLVGVLVYLVGADQARSYLEDLRSKGGDLIEKVNTSRDLIETAE
jgi:hypothetical protein